MKLEHISEGTWVVKSLDGVEKRFPTRKEAEAKAWAQSYAKPPAAPKAPNVTKPKIDLDTVWREVERVVSNIFPDGDPIDYLGPWTQKNGLNYDVIDKAAQKNGYKDLYDYWNSMGDLYKADTTHESEEYFRRTGDQPPADRPWRKHAKPLNKPPTNPDYPEKEFDHDEWKKLPLPKRLQGVVEGPHANTIAAIVSQVEEPQQGDVIRTKKMQMQGKVERVSDDQVFFRLEDGRLMKTPVTNVTVIQPLADEDEEQLNEISTELLAKYKTAAGKDASAADKRGDFATGNKRFSGIVKATKKQFDNDAKKHTKEGSMGGINRSAPAVDVSYEKVLDEVYEMWANDQQLDELSVNKLKAYKDAASSPQVARTMPLRKVAKHTQGYRTAVNKIAAKTGDRTPNQGPSKGVDEDAMGDLVRKQEQPAAPRKVVPIEYNGWTIKYRKASKPTDKVDWVIYNHKMELAHKGESMSDKDAVAAAQEWIDSGAGKSREITGKATIDFNSKFTQQFGEDFFATIDTDKGKPVLIVSYEAQPGLKRSHMRNQKDKLTDTAVKLYSIPMSPKESNSAGLVPNGRYILGPKDDLGDGLSAFPLELHSVAQSKTDRFVLPAPGLTVATERSVEEDKDPCWDDYRQLGMKQKSGKQVPNCVPK